MPLIDKNRPTRIRTEGEPVVTNQGDTAAAGEARETQSTAGVGDVRPDLAPKDGDASQAQLNEIGARDRGAVRRAFSQLFSLFSSSLPPVDAAPKKREPTMPPQPASQVPAALTMDSAPPTRANIRVLEPVADEVEVPKPKASTAQSPAHVVDVKPPWSIQALYADKQFAALYDFVMQSVGAVEREHREWDKLGQVNAFAKAVAFVMKGERLDGSGVDAAAGNIFTRFTEVQERRAVCHLLLLLMPAEDRSERPMLANGSRGAPQDLFRPFPNAIIERTATEFAVRPGDLPKIAPIFTEHLAKATFLDGVFKPGQQGLFLASKKYCPGAFVQDRKDINPPTLDKKQQSGHEGDPIMVKIDDVVVVDGKKMARVHVPAQHKVWLGDDGGCHRANETLMQLDVVTGLDGKPVLGADGKPQPIMIPVEHLAAYMLAEGDGSRGLSMNSAEDRAIALTYAETLKTTWFTDRNGITKNLFEWLEQADHRTPRADVESIRHMAREAAFQTVARYTCHPRRTHFKLDVDPAELQAVKSGAKKREETDWQTQAFLTLQDTGICRDCGNYYEKDKASTQHVHEMAWTAQFLESGYVGGSMDCLGSSDAYDKLSKTFLEPLGILSTTGIAEGHGAALVRVLGQPDDNGIIQAGVPMKVKLNELIQGLEMPLSSGRGPAAQYMENWGGYLRIDGVRGQLVDLKKSQAKLQQLMAGLQ